MNVNMDWQLHKVSKPSIQFPPSQPVRMCFSFHSYYLKTGCPLLLLSPSDPYSPSWRLVRSSQPQAGQGYPCIKHTTVGAYSQTDDDNGGKEGASTPSPLTMVQRKTNNCWESKLEREVVLSRYYN